MSMTKEDGAPAGDRLRSEYKNRNHTEALAKTCNEIMDICMDSIRSCCPGCRACSESGDCYAEWDEDIPKKYDEKSKKFVPTGEPTTKDFARAQIAAQIVALVRHISK